MKSVSAELKAHYAAGTTTLAHLAKLTRRDGFVLAVTLDHDEKITFGGVDYLPALSMIPSNIETSAALNVDNLDAKGALLALGISEADIAAGLWDLCDVRVLRVNWADLSMGAEKLKRGTFGELSVGRNTFSNEVRGITQKLQQTIGDVVSPSCKVEEVGDARCGVVMAEGVWKFSGTAVTAITGARTFTATALTQAAGFFDAGKVTWTTGANAGLSKEIRAHTAGGTIELQEPMPYVIAPADEFTVFAGCLKRATEDCSGKFNNIINFRGFPSVPGQDQMFKGV
jgi:uncharacterized phage protein (TIGR02218 family)